MCGIFQLALFIKVLYTSVIGGARHSDLISFIKVNAWHLQLTFFFFFWHVRTRGGFKLVTPVSLGVVPYLLLRYA
jgi:hypothetical protein